MPVPESILGVQGPNAVNMDEPGQYVLESEPGREIPVYDIEALVKEFPDVESIKLHNKHDPSDGKLVGIVAVLMTNSGPETIVPLGDELPKDSAAFIAIVRAHYLDLIKGAKIVPTEELFDLGDGK